MNNNVFGKTKENFRKHVQVDLITDTAVLRKRVAKPSFCHGIQITDCLTVVQCKVQTLVLNGPIYVGFTVLELSKLHMYDFHYNHMKVKYPHADQLRLLFTDTDSLAYAVQTENIYKDMASDAATKYDFSEYPINYPLYDTSNHKALRFFKDVLNSTPMKEYVGLGPKCYAFLCTGKVDRNIVQHSRPVEKKIAKGVKCKVNEEHLHFTHYLDALHSFQTFVCKQNSSTAHTVRTAHQRKVGLTAFDAKRWLCADTIHTHSHGHRDTVGDPEALVDKSFITCAIAKAFNLVKAMSSVYFFLSTCITHLELKL